MPRENREAPGDRARLGHMLSAAREGISFVQGKARADLDTNAMLRRALVNAIQEIGEAAVRTGSVARGRVAGVDWVQVVKMRNILVHVYWGLDLDIVWQTATEDLAPLIAALDSALASWPDPDR